MFLVFAFVNCMFVKCSHGNSTKTKKEKPALEAMLNRSTYIYDVIESDLQLSTINIKYTVSLKEINNL